MLCLAAAAVGLLPLSSTQLRGRPGAARGAVSACADRAADQALQALQSGDAMQIEEAMAAIIDQKRIKGRSEEDIPNSPLLQRLAEAQRAVNPDVFAAGSAAGASGSVAGGAAADLRRATEPEADAPPQAGEEAWGRWSHGAEGIELQIELAATADGPVRAKGNPNPNPNPDPTPNPNPNPNANANPDPSPGPNQACGARWWTAASSPSSRARAAAANH